MRTWERAARRRTYRPGSASIEGRRDTEAASTRFSARGHAERAQPAVAANRQDGGGNDGVQVEMLVGVDMVEPQTSGREGCELRRDRDREANHVATQPAVAVDEIGDVRRGQGGPTFDQHEVQPHAQPRHAASPGERVGGGVPADHQARGGEDAVAVRFLHGLVDRARHSATGPLSTV